MPTAADRLTAGAGKEATSAAISECVSQMAAEHPDWDNDRCVAACISMSESATGNSSGVGKKTSRRITG